MESQDLPEEYQDKTIEFDMYEASTILRLADMALKGYGANAVQDASPIVNKCSEALPGDEELQEAQDEETQEEA